MNEQGNIIDWLVTITITCLSGLLGIITGHKVHGAKIDMFEERLDRIEANQEHRLNRIEDKIDRLVERL